MIKDKIILTDCDGVCLDWEYGFHTWMSAHGHELKYKDVYSVYKQYEITKDKAKQLVRTFKETASVGSSCAFAMTAKHRLKIAHICPTIVRCFRKSNA